MPPRNWTRQETLAALALYCKLPFGRLHARNPEIIALAKKLGRTPSSVAMKCCNLASLDETHRSRGVRGLAKASRLDQDIWAKFRDRPEDVCYEAAQALASYVTRPPQADLPEYPAVEGLDREAITRVRVNQYFFREMILASYSSACAVCQIRIPEVLVASHIVRWADDPSTRMSPRNGLCLCGTHDLAYERGVLLVRSDYQIEIAERVEVFRGDPPADEWLFRYCGRQIVSPERWTPEPRLLALRYESATKNPARRRSSSPVPPPVGFRLSCTGPVYPAGQTSSFHGTTS